MNYFRTILFCLLICFVFPLMSNAGQLEDANAAIKNKDFKKASKLLLPLVKENNAEAMTLLGIMYVNGQGVENDFNKGMSLIMKAANQGNKDARVAAFKLCLDLANKGNTTAMYNVGYMCLNNWGGEHDTDVCLRWLGNSAKMGHEKSAKILAMIYKKGMFGVTPDEVKATYWSNLQKAYAAGIDGKWEGSVSTEKGGSPMKLAYEFKTDGDRLTGTVAGYGDKKISIEDGKIDGNNISFKVESKFQGVKSTASYTGLFLGDTLELTFASNMGGGGASTATTFAAKRAE